MSHTPMPHPPTTIPLAESGHMRVRQIAEVHGITEGYVRLLITQGRLDAHKIGRAVYVTRESVERLFSGEPR